ncbi:MAG: phage tail family protein, partial [Clostridiales bacterium]|nr:phage tail family protein [Clostridiales bacterium]
PDNPDEVLRTPSAPNTNVLLSVQFQEGARNAPGGKAGVLRFKLDVYGGGSDGEPEGCYVFDIPKLREHCDVGNMLSVLRWSGVRVKTVSEAVMSNCERLIYVNEKNNIEEFSAASVYHVNVARVVGLSDVQNVLYTASNMGQDGETVTGNKISARNISFTGGIKIPTHKKDAVITAMRTLNKVLNPHLKAYLIYECGSKRRVIDCRLETAPAYGRADAIWTFNVDIFCAYPYWRDGAETAQNVAGWAGEFEFPVETGGLEIIEGDMEFGRREAEAVAVIYNAGDVAGGCRIEFTARTTVENPRVTNADTGEYMKFNGLTLNAGDRLIILIITTEYGNKKAVVIRNGGGTETNALRYWDVGGTFLQLEPGENYLAYGADTNEDGLDAMIYHSNNYLSV